MSLLTAVTNVANEAGYTVDSRVIGSTDPTTKQLLAIANRVVFEMTEAHPWSKLFGSASFTLVDGQAEYALPDDFSYYHYETFWNQSTRWRVLGPMTPQEYGLIQGFGLNTTIYRRFMMAGLADQRLLISPTPTSSDAGQIIVFQYAKMIYTLPQEWSVGLSITSGDYIFNPTVGIIYQSGTTGTTAGTAPSVLTGSTTGSDGIAWTVSDAPRETFLADSDEPLLKQKVLEQGMLERFAEIHGIDNIKVRYADQVNELYSRDRVGKIVYANSQYSRKNMFARSGVAVFGTGSV